jgi:hypothetical protein
VVESIIFRAENSILSVMEKFSVPGLQMSSIEGKSQLPAAGLKSSFDRIPASGRGM